MIPLPALEAVIDASGAAPQIEAMLPAGVRARQLTVRTLLAGMCLTQADGRPAHLTRVHQALTSLPEDDQRRLGVIAGWKDGPHLLTYRQTEPTPRTFRAWPDCGVRADAPPGLPGHGRDLTALLPVVGARGNSLCRHPPLQARDNRASPQRPSCAGTAVDLSGYVAMPHKRRSAPCSHKQKSVVTPSGVYGWQSGRVVVEVAGGVTVYPARHAGDRWRAVWYEDGRRRQCQSATEQGLAARIAKVTARLAADAPGLERPGADLIAYYLSPGRHPAGRAWSRKHADTQARLCRRYLAPVIASVACEDIKTGHMQAAVNAAPTAKEGARVRRCISALVGAGLAGGYLATPRLREVHWQPGGRPAPLPAAAIAGESALFVDPAEIPSCEDVTRLGQALAVLASDYELMACLAAYTGLRWGELAALTIAQIDTAAGVVTVDRKVIEIGGHLYCEPPKGRKQRRTIYPRQTPARYPLAQKIAARLGRAAAEQEAGANPLGLVFPSPRGRHWRSSNFARRVLAPAYLAARWRDPAGHGPWTWHSLRHVFCTTALFTWNIDPADVSRLAGHASIRITLDMYIGTTAGTLDRARTATD